MARAAPIAPCAARCDASGDPAMGRKAKEQTMMQTIAMLVVPLAAFVIFLVVMTEGR